MKTIFKSKRFYSLLISFIVALLIWNLYVGIKGENIWALLPISIQLILLILIFTNNQYAKIMILVWTIAFIIVGPGLDVLGYSMTVTDDGLKQVGTYNFAFDILSIIIGVFIVDYTRRTVVVQRPNEVSEF